MNIVLNLEQMLFANLHVGHSKVFLNSRLKGILVGVRKKFCILNVSQSLLQLQIVSNLILNLISRRHCLLLIKEWNYIYFSQYIEKQLGISMPNLVIYEQKWFGGTLSNYKSVFYSKKFKTINLKKLKNKKRFPSVICLFNSNLSKWGLLEGYNLNIPTISLIDSDSIFFPFVNYPIVSSNKQINSSLLYLSVICNSIKYGRKKEITRILRLSEYAQNQPLVKKNIFEKQHIYTSSYAKTMDSYRIWLFRRYVIQGWNKWEITFKE